MSTTLAAGSSVTVSLDPFGTITLVVPGKAALDVNSLADNLLSSSRVSNARSQTYGPYGVPVDVTITAVDRSLQYTVVGKLPMLETDATTGATYLVSTEGNSFDVVGGTLAIEADTTLTRTLRGTVIQFTPGRTLTLGDDAQLIDCQFDFSRITALAHYPFRFIAITGDRVRVSGCRAVDGAGLPFPFEFDSSTVGRFIELTADCDDVEIIDNELMYGFYAVYSRGRTHNNLTICRNHVYGCSSDIRIDDWQGSGVKIEDNEFPAKTHTLPTTSRGEIFVCAGWEYLTVGLTNSVYLTRFGRDVQVRGNRIAQSSHRPIYVINVVGATAAGNHINFEATPGDNAGPLQSDDCLIFELCRDWSIVGNIIYTSGENGVDILGCKRGTITGNVADNCDVLGLAFDWSDAVKAGYSSGFDAYNHMCEDIVSSGNSWAAGDAAIIMKSGRSIKLADKIGKFIGKRSGLGGYDIALDYNASYTSKANGTWPSDLDFSGCTKARVESVLVNAWTSGNALNTSYEHGFNSGDRVSVWLETPASGTMITGIDDITDYYVIRDSATAFRLATSFANATAATPTAIALSGSLVGNLYVGELQAGRISVQSTPGFDVRGFKLSRDLAEVSAPISVAATTNYIHTFVGIRGPRDNGAFRFGLIVRDAPTTFGAGSNSSVSRMIEFPSGYCTDTAVRGVAVQWSDRTQVKFRTGANLLPVPATAVAGSPGTGVAGITSGYLRAIVQ